MYGFAAEIFKHVVHPAHVPLERKPESSYIGGARDTGPRSRLFRQRNGSRMFPVDEDVQIFEKGDGSDIFMPAELVGNPFARLPSIIQVQHRGDGVYAGAVNVIGVQPEQGAVKEKVADLGAVIVEDPAVPVRMVAESGICMV